MKRKSLFSLLLVLILIMTGCGSSGSDTESDEKTTTEASKESGEVSIEDMFTDRDYEVGYDESTSAIIELNGDSASCSSDAVQIDGSTVTITDEGTYILSGTLEDGMIIVNADEKDKPQLVLNGVSIHSETSAPIYILEGDKVFITMAPDSENTLSNGGTFTAIDDNNIDSVIFSKQDLTLNGSGTLTVTSPAGHGIVSKDDLVFTSGKYVIEAASHGLDANDSVRVANAEFTISSGKDGLRAENDEDTAKGFVYIASGTFAIDAEGDGLSSGYYMILEDGTFDIVSGGGSENAAQATSSSWGGFKGSMSGGRGGHGGMGGGGPQDMPGGTDSGNMQSMEESDTETTEDSTSIKAVKAAGDLTINSGTFTIDSADDSVHSNTNVIVNGGTFDIASGDDAFHADDTLTITGGKINISKSYEGLEGLHVGISGGEINLVASDDGINAAGGTDSSGMGGPRGNDQFGGGSSSSGGSIVIMDGDIMINASGDGIDANGTLEIDGGNTVVMGPTQGDTATLDYDSSAVIKGGTFIGTGASGMAQTFSDSEQGVIAVSAGNQAEGTVITLTDSSGKEVVSYTPELSFNVVILSTPDMVKGETYTLTVGSASGEFEAN